MDIICQFRVGFQSRVLLTVVRDCPPDTGYVDPRTEAVEKKMGPRAGVVLGTYLGC